MKSFLEILEEDTGGAHHHVMAFGRMNPPTTGHLKMIDKVKKVAKKTGGTHSVVVSHSQDSKKNPLSSKEKLKHLHRYSPGTHFKAASKDHPTILHHAAEAHKAGTTHLHVVAGSDRVKEMHTLLHKYNGKTGSHGHYHFKKITVHSAGHRDPDAEGETGMSGTKMREHAKNKDFHSFRKGVPHHVSDTHAKELMHDTRKGMGLHEDKNHGMFKAIFVSGGPGSGKDIIIREAIAEQNAAELNVTLALNILNDKHRLAEQSINSRREAIRGRLPLIINGTASEEYEIIEIKEELEELGYETMMVFVNTSNESSKKRNESHERVLSESVRQERWNATQKVAEKFNTVFSKYLEFDNSIDLNEANEFEIAEKERDISIIYEMTNWFFDMPIENETAKAWMYRNKMGDYDALFEQIVNRTQNTPMTAYGKKSREDAVQNQIRNLHMKKRQQNAEIQKSIETLRNRLRFEEKEDVQETSKPVHAEAKSCTCGDKTTSTGWPNEKGGKYKRLKLLDNLCPACQLTAKAGREDDVRDGDIASNTKYTFRTYHEAAQPSIEVKPEPQETRFQQDNDKQKAKRQKGSPAQAGKVLKPAGVSPEYDTRGSGTVYPMSGLGLVTYREQTETKYGSAAEVTRKSFTQFRKESIDSPSVEMGVTGGYHGPSNKEPLDTELEKTSNQDSNKKKKKK